MIRAHCQHHQMSIKGADTVHTAPPPPPPPSSFTTQGQVRWSPSDAAEKSDIVCVGLATPAGSTGCGRPCAFAPCAGLSAFRELTCMHSHTHTQSLLLLSHPRACIHFIQPERDSKLTDCDSTFALSPSLAPPATRPVPTCTHSHPRSHPRCLPSPSSTPHTHTHNQTKRTWMFPLLCI